MQYKIKYINVFFKLKTSQIIDHANITHVNTSSHENNI